MKMSKRAIVRTLSWWVHRLLCYIGIHAADIMSEVNTGEEDGGLSFTEVGTFCPVCMKHVTFPGEKLTNDETK